MISIAMATYNGAKYIREQMDSILAQTVQDYELVVCDDCSSDNTFTILQEYAAGDSRIRIYKNEVNMGFKHNFEKVISLTHGEYIALSDQDDVWMPDHLSVLLDGLNGMDISLACGGSKLIDMDGRDLGVSLSWVKAYDRTEETDNTKIAYTLLFFRNPFQGASMMMRRDFINHALPIPDGVDYHDSWLSALACFCGGLLYIDRPINKYRHHACNVSGLKESRESKLLMWLRHIYRSGMPDRLAMTEAIIKRSASQMTDKGKLLNSSLRYHRRKRHIWGRLRNALYELRHYRLIYSCRGFSLL